MENAFLLFCSLVRFLSSPALVSSLSDSSFSSLSPDSEAPSASPSVSSSLSSSASLSGAPNGLAAFSVLKEDSPVLAKLESGLPPRPPPKALPNTEPKPPFAPAGLTLAKGDEAEPAPPKLRVGIGAAGAAASGLDGDRPPKGDAPALAPLPKTLPLVALPSEPKGDALDAANLAKPELANAELDVPFFSSFVESCDVAASVAALSDVFVSVVGGAYGKRNSVSMHGKHHMRQGQSLPRNRPQRHQSRQLRPYASSSLAPAAKPCPWPSRSRRRS